jgi:hypothetical protein
MQFTRKANQLVTIIPGFKRPWLPLLRSASITRAFWEIIWKPRTCQVQRMQAALETLKAEEERHYELQRAQARKSDIKERRALQNIRKKCKRGNRSAFWKENFRETLSIRKSESLKRNIYSIAAIVAHTHAFLRSCNNNKGRSLC